MRHPREIVKGARYHVSARVNRQEMILDQDCVKDLFLDVLAQAKTRYFFIIEDFCIMGNHIHLVIKPEKGEKLSSIMQWILSVFAMRFNHRYNLTGHVWGERFFSRVIENVVTFINVLTYIDNNPVKAELVSERIDWRYGGLWHHRLGISNIVDLLPDWILVFMPEHRRL